MLTLKNIVKSYTIADSNVSALNDISISFRKNEFVSVLGPSGCGKTTLLNIIGGLDRYDSGELSIAGRSTKKFKDRDWDVYRNHSIGFVFQNYNLISHQTVLSNVELALTLSGVSKNERKRRATEVLTRVGLGDQLNKKPNQMSGGQMQRVAIARALVNDPEILLADEPTGALDSETSVQIMEILKEIADDRLVIMVTHNPELAEQYSTRIVRLLDGKITDDSNPFDDSDEPVVDTKKTNTKEKKQKTSMSFFTALSLSLNNLMTKKARTFMTSFAGSIGIIGIALILALSSGFQTYIDKVQEDTLSTYPLSIMRENVDMTTFFTSMMQVQSEELDHDLDKIYSNNVMTDMMSTMVDEVHINNMRAFKEYLDGNKSNMRDHVSDIQYTYNLDLNVYKEEESDDIVQISPNVLFNDFMGAQQNTGSGEMSIQMGPSKSDTSAFKEMMDNSELLKSQYDIVAGDWPTAYNELVLFVDKNNELTDVSLYSLGIKDQSEFKDIMRKAMEGTSVKTSDVSYYYNDIFDLSYKLVLNTAYYTHDETNNAWVDNREDKEFVKNLIKNGVDLKIVGIVRPNESTVANNTGYIGYTKELTEYVTEQIDKTDIVKQQLQESDIDVFTGVAFPTDDAASSTVTIDDVNAYIATLSPDEQAQMAAYTQGKSDEEIIMMFADKLTVATTEASYDENLKALGVVDLADPQTINIYPKDFESKESIENIIEDYNKDVSEKDEITYTDFIGLIMSSVSTIINTISYVLIAFVAISLIVSSIMIGIITYTSVLERTKEIGVLRSIGASKRDVSRVFNAETLIVGSVAGLLGILITVLLTIPINAIIEAISDIANVAYLPVGGAAILVAISMVLTLVAGLIPSRIAAKKDPVVALRSE